MDGYYTFVHFVFVLFPLGIFSHLSIAKGDKGILINTREG